jgi:predicted amidophosphoribosyltransferase
MRPRDTSENWHKSRSKLAMRELQAFLLRSLFRCISCDTESPTAKCFPLCEHCLRSLIAAPKLCPQCSSPACLDPELKHEGVCTRPWIQAGPIDSQFALFQLTDAAYSTLKRWKTRRGPLFDRRVFQQANLPALKNYIQEKAIQAIIPMPQSYWRSWKMGGSPADVLATWISEKTRVPKIQLLKKSSRRKQKRQAELGGWLRMQSALHFEVHPERLINSILLVDDFSTTGHTLTEASFCLKGAGFQKVHTLCLGMRSR